MDDEGTAEKLKESEYGNAFQLMALRLGSLPLAKSQWLMARS
jgi:hypothetical protein